MHTRAARLPRRLALLPLDDRTLPAVTPSAVNGVLTVLGDDAANAVTITQANGQITVANVGAFPVASVRALTVDAGAGDDTVTLDPSVMVPALLFGGTGNDRLTGGSGADQ